MSPSLASNLNDINFNHLQWNSTSFKFGFLQCTSEEKSKDCRVMKFSQSSLGVFSQMRPHFVAKLYFRCKLWYFGKLTYSMCKSSKKRNPVAEGTIVRMQRIRVNFVHGTLRNLDRTMVAASKILIPTQWNIRRNQNLCPGSTTPKCPMMGFSKCQAGQLKTQQHGSVLGRLIRHSRQN